MQSRRWGGSRSGLGGSVVCGSGLRTESGTGRVCWFRTAVGDGLGCCQQMPWRLVVAAAWVAVGAGGRAWPSAVSALRAEQIDLPSPPPPRPPVADEAAGGLGGVHTESGHSGHVTAVPTGGPSGAEGARLEGQRGSGGGPAGDRRWLRPGRGGRLDLGELGRGGPRRRARDAARAAGAAGRRLRSPPLRPSAHVAGRGESCQQQAPGPGRLVRYGGRRRPKPRPPRLLRPGPPPSCHHEQTGPLGRRGGFPDL